MLLHNWNNKNCEIDCISTINNNNSNQNIPGLRTLFAFSIFPKSLKCMSLSHRITRTFFMSNKKSTAEVLRKLGRNFFRHIANASQVSERHSMMALTSTSRYCGACQRSYVTLLKSPRILQNLSCGFSFKQHQLIHTLKLNISCQNLCLLIAICNYNGAKVV